MSIQIVRRSELSPERIPDWLHAFEWVDVEPGGEHERPAAGLCMLLYIVDGVVDLRQGPDGLRRSLQGELVVMRGQAVVNVGNGSHVDGLRLCLMALAEDSVVTPQVASRYFSDDDKSGAFHLVANEAGTSGTSGALAHGAVPKLSLTLLGRGETVVREMAASDSGWACAVSGCFAIDDVELEPGDCALITDVEDLRVSATAPGQMLLIEQHG